jgi:iron complex transport system permease protein
VCSAAQSSFIYFSRGDVALVSLSSSAGSQQRPRRVLLVLALVTAAATVSFMTIGVRGDWGFVLPFRSAKLAGMLLVGAAIAMSTVLFQTVTQNRILTPAVMGFDSLYIVIQTVLVFTLGAHAASTLDPQTRFLLQALLMTLAAMLIFRWLFGGTRQSLHLLLLSGIVFGVLCRSLSGLLQRLLDPNEFTVLQDSLFARFNVVDATLLPVAGVAILAAGVAAWRLAPTLDVLALGRENAIGLGVDYRRLVSIVLAIVAILVSVSTALVGPVLFFGLLVSNLAYHLLGTSRHRYSLPAATLLAVTFLIGGQTILERVFGFNTALSVVIEFVGGIVFILLLLKGNRP